MDTRQKILDVSQELVQKSGYNAFSYADVSAVIGIRKASIHYHFPTKTDLGVALIDNYGKVFADKLSEIDERNTNALEKLKGYIGLYQSTLLDNRMCLCGMLASDSSTLPKEVRAFVDKFFADNESWLAKVLEEGKTQKVLSTAGKANEQSQFLLSSIQGALLVSRATNSVEKFKKITGELLNTLRIKD